MNVCIYSRGDSHPCCAVLQDFPQLGIWVRLCALLASPAFRDANYSHG